MGYPGKNHKQYGTPKRRFEKTRLEEDRKLVIEFGLRNKRELWRAQSRVKKYRQGARDLLAMMSGGTDQARVETKKSELLGHLYRNGLLGQDADIDDVLSMKTEQQLDRRLQTIAYRRGLARSPKQARQLITHGHVAIAGKKITIPGYTVTRTEELDVEYYRRSGFTNEVHPERVRIVKGGR